MRKNVRRVSVAAALATIPALVFGAQAASAAEDVEAAKRPHPHGELKLAERGTVESVREIPGGKTEIAFSIGGGLDVTWLVTDETRVVDDKRPASASDIDLGDEVVVFVNLSEENETRHNDARINAGMVNLSPKH